MNDWRINALLLAAGLAAAGRWFLRRLAAAGAIVAFALAAGGRL